MIQYVLTCLGVSCVSILGVVICQKKYNEPQAPTIYYTDDPLDKPLLNKYLIKTTD